MKFSKKTLIMAASMMLCMAMTALGTVAYLTDRAAVANTFTVGNIDITVDEAVVDANGKTDNTNAGKKRVDQDNNPNTPDQAMTKEGYEAWVQDKIDNSNGELTQDDFPAFDTLPDANRTEKGNQYKLIPGMIYDKDPTMTVKAGNEEAYVRMAVTINKIAELKAIFGEDFSPTDIIEGWDKENWPLADKMAGKEENTMVYYCNYKGTVNASEEDQKLPPLFTHIKIDEGLTKEQLATLQELKITVEGHAIQTAAFEGEDAVKKAWAAFDDQNNKKQDEGN